MKRLVVLSAVMLFVLGAMAQQGGHNMQHNHEDMMQDTSSKATIPAHNHTMHGDTMQTAMHAHHEMYSAYSLNLPMNRNGSGTSWQPDESPMYMYMVHAKAWNIMVHGAMFTRYTSQNVNNKGMRGSAAQFNAPNWGMLMAQRRLGKHGLLNISAMLSADRLTIGGEGYPLLFQSGESWKGEPLIDRQHPHDLFAALSIAYTHSFTKDIDLYAYFGYPGEPALGPTAFMHRISAFSNPDAPLGHHWQDATHITFGVGTIGFRYKIAKIEGSIFTGREPDENRFDFDKPRFDSYSYRLSINPHRTLSLQFSQGFIRSPEALEPDENVMKTSFSIQHVKAFSPKSFVASTVVYGLNTKHHSNEHSVLAEATYLIKRFDIYGRYEFVQKSTHEMALEQYGDKLYNIHAFTLGAAWRFFSMANLDLALGGQLSTYAMPGELKALYGSNMPVSYQVYLRIMPSMMKMNM